MSASDKFSNKADDLAGKAKEGFGKATGDRGTENEGKVDDAIDLAHEMFKAGEYEIDFLDCDGKNVGIYEYP